MTAQAGASGRLRPAVTLSQAKPFGEHRKHGSFITASVCAEH